MWWWAGGGGAQPNISGGQLKRVSIGIELVAQPTTLFLDEPTVGLDPIARDAVWKHLVELRTNYGTTLFFTTHYMEEAESYCDRIAIMQRGKVSALGTCRELEASFDGGSHTLNEVFNHYAGSTLESGSSFRDVSAERSKAQRLG